MSDDIDVDEVVEQHKADTEGGRASTEPTAEHDDSDDTPSLEDAVADAYGRLDDGDLSSNLTLRDDNLAALFSGLEQSGRLADVGERAAEHAGRDDQTDTRAAVLRTLVRIGLREVDESLIDAGKAGRDQHFESDEF